MRHPSRVQAMVLVALLAGAAFAGAQPKPCDIDVVPAATLLVPYFVASGTHPPSVNTFLAVVNPTATTRIAHFTLWTDYAIPTANFDLVLTPNDVQTYDLTSLFLVGPALGPEATSCQGSLRPGTLHLNPALGTATTTEEKLALLRLAHSGGTLPVGKVAGSPTEELVGYLTIDVVNRCSDLSPASEGYFVKGGKGVASDANALLGDMFWTDYVAGRAAAEPMVHVRAHPTAFKSGQYTFYGRYVNRKAWDDRQPLGRTYGNRYVLFRLDLTSIDTLLFVWRDTKSPSVALVDVGAKPTWAYLPLASFNYWDEEENGYGAAVDPPEFGLATQAIDLIASSAAVAFPFGWMKVDFGHRKSGLFGRDAQAWVSVLMVANNFPNPNPVDGSTVLVGQRAFQLVGLCKP